MREHVINRIQAGPHVRLGWYRKKWAVSDWDEHVWQHIDRVAMERHLASLERAHPLVNAFARYLPNEGRVIEAGCGLGHWVALLKDRGYNIQGTEIGEPTVRKAKEFFPDALLSVSDICHLPFPNGSFRAYVSLGVVEHNEGGPEPALAEARRILTNQGLLLCAVPFFSVLRKLRRRPLGRPHGFDFYQWSFSTAEFSDLLRTAGFEVQETIPYSTLKTLTDELPLLKTLQDMIRTRTRAPTNTRTSSTPIKTEPTFLRRTAGYLADNLLEARPLRSCAGHMRLYVAVKR